jgi:GNAT superfamily N-acetyltransferase
VTVSVQQLTIADLPDCTALALDRNWGAETRKWRLLFDVGTVYGVRDAGRLVGATILTRHGDRLAAISMVLVASSHGRQGIGGTLMRHAMAQAGDAILTLNATRYGRPLYERLGFETVGATHTHAGIFTPDGRPARSRPADAGDLPAIGALDTEVNGADRSALLRLLPGFCEQLRVIEHDGEITGYGGTWRNDDTLMIGPVIARSTDDAQALINDLVPAGERTRADLDGRHPRLRAWAERRGLLPGFDTAVMTCGGPLPGARDRWLVPVMQALG